MDEKEIIERARTFLSNKINLEIIQEIPTGAAFYNLNLDDVVIVRFSLFEGSGFGSDKYLAVSKEEGSVRFLGFHGE